MRLQMPMDVMMRDTEELLGRSGPAGWWCSSCGELITSIEDGWVEWLVGGEDEKGASTISGLHLVHRDSGSTGRCCRYDPRQEFAEHLSIVEGLPLARFVGPDGLMLLLLFLASGEMPKQEVLELAKRVQIPGYEQSRELLRNMIEQGLFSASMAEGFYLQSEIQTVLQWALRTEVA